MQTKTLVEASADIITITSLKSGDVYKRLEKSYSGYSVLYGVVTSVLHNGTDAAVLSIEWKSKFEGVESEAKVFGTEDDLKIFAASPDEVAEHLEDIKRAGERAIREAEKKKQKAEEALERATEAYEIAARDGLTSPASVNA